MEIKNCREEETSDAKARRKKGMGEGREEEKEARTVAAFGEWSGDVGKVRGRRQLGSAE